MEDTRWKETRNKLHCMRNQLFEHFREDRYIFVPWVEKVHSDDLKATSFHTDIIVTGKLLHSIIAYSMRQVADYESTGLTR